MLLAINAIEMSHSHDLRTFVLATSDGDFRHLAHQLRERGFTVIGAGEAKTPHGFRQACTSFVELENKAAKSLTPFDRQINDLLNQAGKRGLRITQLSLDMKRLHNALISAQEKKTWRAYLSSKSDLYDCDPKGPTAMVRLKT